MPGSVYAQKFSAFLTSRGMTFRELADAIDVPLQILTGMCERGDAPQQYIIDRLDRFTGQSWEVSAEEARQYRAEHAQDKEDVRSIEDGQRVLSPHEYLLLHIEDGIQQYGSKAKFAEAIGCSLQSVFKWCSGTVPSRLMQTKIASALEMNPEDLLKPRRAEQGKPEEDGPQQAEKGNQPVADLKEAADPVGATAAAEEVQPVADVNKPSAEQQPVTVAEAEEPEPRDKESPVRRNEAGTMLGEEIINFKERYQLSLEELVKRADMQKDGGVNRLRGVIVGYLYPKKAEMKQLAHLLGVSAQDVKIMARLPSSTVRGLARFPEVAAQIGLGFIEQPAADSDLECPAAEEKSSLQTPKAAAPVPQPIICRHRTDDQNAFSLNGIAELSIKGGILGQLIKEKRHFLYTVGTSAFLPAFSFGDTLLVEEYYGETATLSKRRIAMSGWYLIPFGKTYALRHLAPRQDGIAVLDSGSTVIEIVPTVTVVGRVVASINLKLH